MLNDTEKSSGSSPGVPEEHSPRGGVPAAAVLMPGGGQGTAIPGSGEMHSSSSGFQSELDGPSLGVSGGGRATGEETGSRMKAWALSPAESSDG